MPEIDSSLYQILTLVLLLVIALALVGIASALAGIKKSFGADSARAPERDREPDRENVEQPEARAPAREAEPAFARREEPAGATSPALGVEPAGGAATQAEPTTAAAAGGGVAGAGSAAAGVQAEAEPQEQPFERDGRWWFRRGDELLVYDERSGQWVAAPESAPAPAGAAAAAPAQEGGGASEGGFWKCPSCGAVNGSTATSCRMCFTARP